jgi:hypothetical protein
MMNKVVELSVWRAWSIVPMFDFKYRVGPQNSVIILFVQCSKSTKYRLYSLRAFAGVSTGRTRVHSGTLFRVEIACYCPRNNEECLSRQGVTEQGKRTQICGKMFGHSTCFSVTSAHRATKQLMLLVVPISGSASAATTGYGGKDLILPEGLLLFLCEEFMCSSYGCFSVGHSVWSQHVGEEKTVKHHCLQDLP